MDGCRIRFKDSCYAKTDWIVLIDVLEKLRDLCTILSWSLHMQNPMMGEEDKKELIYSIIMSRLMQEDDNEDD